LYDFGSILLRLLCSKKLNINYFRNHEIDKVKMKMKEFFFSLIQFSSKIFLFSWLKILFWNSNILEGILDGVLKVLFKSILIEMKKVIDFYEKTKLLLFVFMCNRYSFWNISENFTNSLPHGERKRRVKLYWYKILGHELLALQRWSNCFSENSDLKSISL